MHHCLSCSYKASRRRNKTSTSHGKNQNKANMIDWQLMDWQLTNELRVNLDKSVVGKYLKAKKLIDQILRPDDEAKRQFIESCSCDCNRISVDTCDDGPSYEVPINENLRESSIETRPASNTSCENAAPSIESIKDEMLENPSCITLYDYENLEADLQIVEIPFGSNIVLNPMNNRVAFSQIDPSFINNNEADATNANINDRPQGPIMPKYLYNPMNNIITPGRTNDDSDCSNGNEPNVMPADVQFEPGEYTMEDSFLNDSYNVVNTFSLEPCDMDSNQNELTSQSSVEEICTTPLFDSFLNASTTTDEFDSTNCEKTDVVEAFVNEQGSSLPEMEQNVEREPEQNICSKCHKKFKVSRYLRKHELTCGITFDYNCLFCTKTSILSHTIKCHMASRHIDQIEIYGMKEIMEIVIKKRKENKETNLNNLLKKENQDLPELKSNFAPVNNIKKNDRRKQSFPKTRSNSILEIKKKISEEHYQERDSSNEQNSYSIYVNESDDHEENFKPSKEYIDALCSCCKMYLKSLKSGTIKCCPNCQSALIYKCAVCKKCFSKYLSIMGHVKCHSKPISSKVLAATDDKHYCGYCNYEADEKSKLLQHILWHIHGKSVKIKSEYSG